MTRGSPRTAGASQASSLSFSLSLPPVIGFRHSLSLRSRRSLARSFPFARASFRAARVVVRDAGCSLAVCVRVQCIIPAWKMDLFRRFAYMKEQGGWFLEVRNF